MKLEEEIKKLEYHILHEHRQSAVAAYLKEVIYGGVDGIITTFAVVAGFSGAALSGDTTLQLSFLVVLLFGLANLFADGVSMGLGNFLSVRSDQSLYCRIRGIEISEIRNNPEGEAEETKAILIQKGFSREDAKTLTDIYQKNESYWADFMMKHELNISDSTDDNPARTGLATFLSFVFFGFIPLTPFIFFHSFAPQMMFLFASLGAFLALILLGVLKWKVVRTSFVKSISEVVLIGGAAATVAFTVGTLFTL